MGDLVESMIKTVESSVSKVFVLKTYRPEFNSPRTHMKKLSTVASAYGLSTEEMETNIPGIH